MTWLSLSKVKRPIIAIDIIGALVFLELCKANELQVREIKRERGIKKEKDRERKREREKEKDRGREGKRETTFCTILHFIILIAWSPYVLGFFSLLLYITVFWTQYSAQNIGLVHT